MTELEIKISPTLSNNWYISFEDSFKFGVNVGVIYTPRYMFKYEADNLENSPNFYQRQAESISHEFLHKLLFELENKETSKQLDNISKSANNETYIL
jgi:hypothetical protein